MQPLVKMTFENGQHDVANEMAIPKGYVRRAMNFNIDNSGVHEARRKFVKVGPGGHSPYTTLDKSTTYLFDGALMCKLVDGYRIPVYNEAGGQYSMQAAGRVWYVEANDVLMFSNGVDSGCIGPDGIARPWGETKEIWFVGKVENTELTPLKLEPFPPSVMLARHGGKIYGAVDNIVYNTQAMNYSSYDPRYDFIIAPGTVTMLGAVPDGLYISTTDTVYFYKPSSELGGTGELTPVSRVPAIYGSQAYVPFKTLGIDEIDKRVLADAVCWLTTEGLVAGMEGGNIFPITAGVAKVDGVSSANSALLDSGGIYQFVSVVKYPASTRRTGAVDSVSVSL